MRRPITTALPVKHASRWNSPYEAEDLEPLVKVFLSQPAYSRICVHSASDTSVEVGGVLVGHWCLGPQHEQFVVIEHALPARHTRQGGSFVTFTSESLLDFHDQIDTSFKGMLTVGWYHTHPGMGIFMSHYDLWLHRHFFPEPWQVALVVEPVAAAAGFFVRQRQDVLDPTRYFGFYELDGTYGRSMVDWTNLHPDSDQKGNAST
jgi:proteasome lid subunit RPN8/RPN11